MPTVKSPFGDEISEGRLWVSPKGDVFQNQKGKLKLVQKSAQRQERRPELRRGFGNKSSTSF